VTPANLTTIPPLTPEIVEEYQSGYAVAINEVSNSLLGFAEVANNSSIVNQVNMILSQLEAIKNCVSIPNNEILMEAIEKVSNDFVSLCASVYYYLISLDDVILRELMMEAMQTSLHNLIIIEVSAGTKGLYYNIFNPDLMLFISFRSMLLIVSVILKTLTSLDIFGEEEEVLSPQDIESAVSYILHFGRPCLFKGEDLLNKEESEEEIITTTIEVPVTNQSPTSPTTQVTVNTTANTNSNTNTNTSTQISIQPVTTNNTVKTTTTNTTTTSPQTPKTVSNTNTTNSTITNSNSNINSNANTNSNTNTNTNTNTNSNTNTNTTTNTNTNTTNNAPKTNNPPPTNTTSTTATNSPSGYMGLLQDDDFVLNCDPDSFSKDNLPPGFPAAPFLMKFERTNNTSEQEYKNFMQQKYEYEGWENKMLLFKRKLKERKAARKKELGMS